MELALDLDIQTFSWRPQNRTKINYFHHKHSTDYLVVIPKQTTKALANINSQIADSICCLVVDFFLLLLHFWILHNVDLIKRLFYSVTLVVFARDICSRTIRHWQWVEQQRYAIQFVQFNWVKSHS